MNCVHSWHTMAQHEPISWGLPENGLQYHPWIIRLYKSLSRLPALLVLRELASDFYSAAIKIISVHSELPIGEERVCTETLFM